MLNTLLNLIKTVLSYKQDKLIAGGGIIISSDGKTIISEQQIQSDWNQVNSNSKDYIKNKPTYKSTEDINTYKVRIKSTPNINEYDIPYITEFDYQIFNIGMTYELHDNNGSSYISSEAIKVDNNITDDNSVYVLNEKMFLISFSKEFLSSYNINIDSQYGVLIICLDSNFEINELKIYDVYYSSYITHKSIVQKELSTNFINEYQNIIDNKQDKLIAGNGIEISDDGVISCTFEDGDEVSY